jgi:DNA invertase Pin-like site-specific DNA recombinase
MNENNRCIIYARVSTEQQHEENQVPECQEYANQLGLEVAEVIQEKISAFKNPERESLKKLMNYPHIVCWSYDRLYRHRIKFIQAMQYFSLKGVKIHSVKERWFEEFHKIPAPFNEILYDLMLQLVGWLGEEESRKRAERVRLAYNNKRDGLHWGRIAKAIDIERLKESYNPNSLRGTARRYNESLRGANRISYVTVKKVIDKNPDIFNSLKPVNQKNDWVTLKG